MVSYCCVLDEKERKLSPTNENKGWYLIRKGKAKLVHKFPMVIQLSKEVPEEEIDQTPTHFNIDDGSKFTGIALVQEGRTKNKPVFKGSIEHRTDVKYKMNVRRGYRRYKRSHKKYRPKRFSNRSSSKRNGPHDQTEKRGHASSIESIAKMDSNQSYPFGKCSNRYSKIRKRK